MGYVVVMGMSATLKEHRLHVLPYDEVALATRERAAIANPARSKTGQMSLLA